MTQDNDRHDRALGLSTAQVAGSALAAMSGAFFASWLGTTGTLVGAAVGSVVATIGAAIYTHSLQRTGKVVKRTAVQVRHGALLTGAVPQPDPGTASEGPVRDPNAPREGDPSAEEAAEEARDNGDKGRGRLSTLLSEKLDLSWVKVALASLAVLVVALAGITVVEAITGKPIASWFGRDGGTGTTVGHVVGSDNKSSEPDKTPTKQTPATPEPTPSESPSEQPEEPPPSTPPVPSPTPTPSPSTGADGAGAPPVESQAPAPGDDQP